MYKTIIKYLLIILVSYALTNFSLLSNHFIFIIPFILIMFIDNKRKGIISLIVFYLTICYIDIHYLYSIFIVVPSLFFIKISINSFNKKMSFLSFFITFLLSIISELIFNSYNFHLSFLCSVLSFWITYFLINVYFEIETKGVINDLKNSICLCSLIGVILLGLNIPYASVVLLVVFVYLMSKIDLSLGIVTSSFFAFMLFFNNENYLLLLVLSFLAFLLNKNSKMSYLFSSFLLYFCLFTFSIDIFISLMISNVLILFINEKTINTLKKYICINEAYLNYINKSKEKKNREISKKVLLVREIIEIINDKVKKKRIKKLEKELFCDEDYFLKNAIDEIYGDCIKSNEKEIIEKELIKYNIELIEFSYHENIFSKKEIKISLKSFNKDLEKIIISLITKEYHCDFKIKKIKENKYLNIFIITLEETSLVNFEFGVGQRSKDKQVSGDSYLHYENDRYVIFALSDGMGSGVVAKERSKETLNLLRKFLSIGFEINSALHSINYLLKEDFSSEGYSTLDVLLYDKEKKSILSLKNGASNSLIVKENECAVVDGENLPLGIVEKNNYCFKKFNVEDSYFVMVSDGIHLKENYKYSEFNKKTPQQIVQEILKSNTIILDDQSVMVIKIKKV